MVRPPARLCLRPCRQRHRRRHAGDAAAGDAPDRERSAGAAPISCSALSPPSIGGGLSLLIENDPRDRGLGPDGDPPQPGAHRRWPEGASVARSDPVAPLHRPLCGLPDLLVRRVRAVRPSRALREGSRRRALICRAAARRDRRRQHRRTLLSRRPRRPAGPPAFAAADVRRHGARVGDLGVLDQRLVARRLRLRLSASSTADGSRCCRPW